ncbi:dihydrofolate reductase [Saccharicrinis sp. FJH54]|uniref:dipeptidyl-peptidase 3 family protein n=1 Tax=Saccharicrinis sp. FJH54 TaxID=3344665 RepID=UPI0035D465AA
MKYLVLTTLLTVFIMNGCTDKKVNEVKNDTFNYNVEKFADLKIIRYKVPGFEDLSLKQKELIYYLSQAAIEGRDIIFDQNYKYNLPIRQTLEAIYENYNGDKENADYKNFVIYLKRVWFSNGIHHHYSMDKFKPGFSQNFFVTEVNKVPEEKLPMVKADLLKTLVPVIFDPEIAKKRVSLAEGKDLIKASANNYYEGDLSQDDVEEFYAQMKVPDDNEPISYGLNSTLVKKDGKISEEVWKTDGKYGPAIKHIVYWLEKAAEVAENDNQKTVINLLIEFYNTGDLRTFDKYNVAWLQDQASRVDFVNGFIETYGDPLGLKASWESIVDFKDLEATHRTEIISSNAQWFEDHSPVDDRFKKKKVKGVSAKVITAAMLGGDCYPATPIGINLPNADWIRKEYGSKSVTLENITYAYDQSAKGNGFLQEFAYDQAEIDRVEKYGFMTGNLHTDLHECLGHGSGQLLPGVAGDELKAYGATIEEARADLFGLYYMADPKLVELGLLPNKEAFKAEYDSYIRNGLMTQLTRIEPGDNIEESHMRNRQLIAEWTFEHGKDENVIEEIVRDGKTYFKINDYEKMHKLLGQLLALIQKIKSTGDYAAAKNLVETYGVIVNQDLLKEVKERYAKLDLAPYGGFINPSYKLIEKDGSITDVEVSYPDDYAAQMLNYSKHHSWLTR